MNGPFRVPGFGRVRLLAQVLAGLALSATPLPAQLPPASPPPGVGRPAPGTAPASALSGTGRNTLAASSVPAPAQVVIEREPLVIKGPESFRTPLSLEAARSVEIVALADGVVSNILIKDGEEARKQAEIIRLDSRERQLMFDRAKAAFQAAQIEQRAAETGAAKEVADVRLQIAKIELDLAEYQLDQTIHRAPFEGRVQTVHVVDGQFVRAGEPLATLVDTSQLIARLPIDRAATRPGDGLELRVEGKLAPAKVQQVLPLISTFEPLRELFQSVATGVAVIENGAGEWHAGQTVYAALIPRHPVTEVPNGAIANANTGGRKVQVMRDGFVRDVPVELLGAVGEERTFVTGQFSSRDELIVRTSEALADGTQVVARTELVDPSVGGAAPATSPSAPPPGAGAPARRIPPASQ